MMDYEQDVKKFKLDMHCPRCGHLVRAVPQTQPIFHISQYSDTEAYLIVRCPRDLCDVAFVVYDRLNNRVRRVYPFPKTSASDFHQAIPEKMREDFGEARRCWYIDANKGVVVMCRRVLQHITLDKGATGRNLMEQINDMLAKGLITRSLHDAAHEVRYFGNFGAHPQDDSLDNISDDDAKIVMDIVNQFLLDLYVRPSETAKLTQKRDK